MGRKRKRKIKQSTIRLKSQANKVGFTATKNYYRQAVLSATPSYVLSVGDRYEDFNKWARDYSNDFMSAVTQAPEQYSSLLTTEIGKAETEEKALAAAMLKNLGKPVSASPMERLLILLSKTFQTKIQKYTIDPSFLPDLVKYQIGKFYSDNPNKSVLGSDEYIAFFKKIESKEKDAAKYRSAALAIKQNINKMIETGDISSPAVIRQLDIFSDNSLVLQNTKELPSGFLYGFGGTLFEPLAMLSVEEAFVDLSKQSAEQLKLKISHTGSIEADKVVKLVESRMPKKLVIGNKGLENYREGTNLKGDTTLGKSDFVFTLKEQTIGVDVKLSNKKSQVYKVNSPTLSGAQILESAAANNLPMEGIVAALNSVLNMVQITNGFDKKALEVILRPILIALVTSEKTIQSFTSYQQNGKKAYLVLVNDKFYAYSDILKSIQKTYLNPRGKGSPIAKANHTFTVANLEGLISTSEANKSLLLGQKQYVLSAGKPDNNPMKRLDRLQANTSGDNNIKSIFDKYNTALNSVSYKVFLTLDFKKILREYSNK